MQAQILRHLFDVVVEGDRLLLRVVQITRLYPIYFALPLCLLLLLRLLYIDRAAWGRAVDEMHALFEDIGRDSALAVLEFSTARRNLALASRLAVAHLYHSGRL